MPKLKTNKAAAKRFKITKSGNIKRSNAFRRHLLNSKTANRKRRLRKTSYINFSDIRVVKKMLPYS